MFCVILFASQILWPWAEVISPKSPSWTNVRSATPRDRDKINVPHIITVFPFSSSKEKIALLLFYIYYTLLLDRHEAIRLISTAAPFFSFLRNRKKKKKGLPLAETYGDVRLRSVWEEHNVSRGEWRNWPRSSNIF